jgi:hypothetical protein
MTHLLGQQPTCYDRQCAGINHMMTLLVQDSDLDSLLQTVAVRAYNGRAVGEMATESIVDDSP